MIFYFYMLTLTLAGIWGLWSMRNASPYEPDGRRYCIDDITSAEMLDHWANIYRANHKLQRRLKFVQFLRNPKGYVNAYLLPTDLGDPYQVEPLLAPQKLVYERVLLAELSAEEQDRRHDEAMRKLQREYADISTNDNRPFAPMHPHRKTRKWQTHGFQQLEHKPT